MATATATGEIPSSAPPASSPTPAAPGPFRYPPHYSFPPFYTLQPNLATRTSQLTSWSSLILSFCAAHRLFRLTPSHALFTNTTLRRTLAPDDARVVLAHMVERGDAEWLDKERGKKDKAAGGGGEVWVWWRTPEEWAASIAGWVEVTGQRNTVLTFYELLEGDATRAEVFWGLPVDMAKRAVNVLVRRGKASVFGDGEGQGVKFYF